MLIYIIDDDPDWQRFYKNVLGDCDYHDFGQSASNYSTASVLNSREKTPAGGSFPGEESRERVDSLKLKVFPDGISAMSAIDDQLPDAILLDMLLIGPAGTSLLAELQSYPDTAKIPIALISGVDIQDDLSSYGVSKVFNKASFEPKELLAWISKLAP